MNRKFRKEENIKKNELISERKKAERKYFFVDDRSRKNELDENPLSGYLQQQHPNVGSSAGGMFSNASRLNKELDSHGHKRKNLISSRSLRSKNQEGVLFSESRATGLFQNQEEPSPQIKVPTKFTGFANINLSKPGLFEAKKTDERVPRGLFSHLINDQSGGPSPIFMHHESGRKGDPLNQEDSQNRLGSIFNQDFEGSLKRSDRINFSEIVGNSKKSPR